MRDIMVLMQVKIRRRADAMQVGMYGWRRGIDGGKDTKTRQCLAVEVYEWRHGIDEGKDTDKPMLCE